MTALRPFFRYHGAKWRATAAGLYQAPQLDVIIEPFAGAAGYALHHPERQVILVEKYPVIAEIWRWLISASVDEIMAIPPVDDVADLPPQTALGARYLVGFAMNAACTSPRRRIARSGLALRAAGRRFYGWTEAFRERVASQVPHIRHWRVIEGDYTEAPDVAATWFVDPPYILQGGGICMVRGDSTTQIWRGGAARGAGRRWCARAPGLTGCRSDSSARSSPGQGRALPSKSYGPSVRH